MASFLLVNRIYSSIAQSVERRTVKSAASVKSQFLLQKCRFKSTTCSTLLTQNINYTVITRIISLPLANFAQLHNVTLTARLHSPVQAPHAACAPRTLLGFDPRHTQGAFLAHWLTARACSHHCPHLRCCKHHTFCLFTIAARTPCAPFGFKHGRTHASFLALFLTALSRSHHH